jgi:hypothetical protein
MCKERKIGFGLKIHRFERNNMFKAGFSPNPPSLPDLVHLMIATLKIRGSDSQRGTLQTPKPPPSHANMFGV